ncbi:MAG: pyridoxamine 5'-phosphate oxidase family protein [Nitrosopumilus sp.]|nr:pyridoxamine 5'-phosphate oxidase family protein [Nitrosopumilus sp.]
MKNLDDIKSEKYISVETYKKDGTAVKTPVWFTIKDNLVYVVTRDQTGKIKRLKNNHNVKIATCNIKGKISGKWVSGTVEILGEYETKEAVKRRDKKYGFFSKVARFLTKNKGELVAFSIKIDRL